MEGLIMAYKFQLGAAKLGGAITSTGTISGSIVDSQGALSGASIQVDDASGIAGDALENNSGVLKVSDGGITNNMLSGAIEGTKLANGAVGNVQLSGNISADKLNLASGVMSSSGGELTLTDGAVTNSMLSGAVELSKLETVTAADIIVANGSGVPTAVAMSGHVAIDDAGATTIQDDTITSAMVSGTLAGDKIALNANQLTSDGGQINLKSSISGALTFTNNITIDADLIVTGDTFSASVGTLLIEDNHIVIADGASALATGQGLFIGADDNSANELASFEVASGSEIGFNFSSSLPLQAGTLSGDSAFIDQWEIGATHISGNLPVSASEFYGDGSNLTNISADNASSLRLNGANQVASASLAAAAVGNLDAILLDTDSQAITVTMPDISSDTIGRVYIIKDVTGGASTSAGHVTISSSAAGHNLDGDNFIKIESGFGAVNLLACSASNGFFYSIF